MVTSDGNPFEAQNAEEISNQAVLAELRAALVERNHPLNEHEIMLLGIIVDGCTVGELNGHKVVALKNVSTPLINLARKGYVIVEDHDTDKRRRVVRRTAKGRTLVEMAGPILAKLRAERNVRENA